MSVEELITKLVSDFTRFRLDCRVDKGQAVVGIDSTHLSEFAAGLKEHSDYAFNMLMDLTAVDWLNIRSPRFDVVYHFYSVDHNLRLRVKLKVEEGQSVSTLTHLYPVADWFEREVWDLYGIKFAGHPNLKRILLYEEFKGYPLRKDYPYDKRQPLEPETWPARETQVHLKEAEVIHRP